MSSSNSGWLGLALAAAFAAGAAAQTKLDSEGAIAAEPFGIGRSARAAEIKGWAISVRPDGHGSPPGRGSVKDGDKLYQEKCAHCHGEFGEGKDRWPPLIAGSGKLTDDDPKKGVGNFWPYATTLFDYIKRAMPFGDAQSLADDEIYAITAYVLHLNDLLKEDAVLDRDALIKMQMPNAGGFIDDPRPDVKSPQCMTNCRTTVEIHSEARKIDVTPADERVKKPGLD